MRTALLFWLLVSAVAPQPSLRERMLLVEDQRGTSPADLDVLRQGLASRDVMTRRQAVRAIGRLERPDLMPLISRLLTDPNPDVRIETANAIGQMARGEAGLQGAKSRLMARARAEQTPRVRGAVAATLGRLPYTAASDVQDVERVIAALVPASPTVVNLDEIVGAVEGLEALIRQSSKLSPPSADTLGRLRVASKLEGRAQDAQLIARIRRLATLALVAAGHVTRDLLEAWINDPDDEVRRLAMMAARAEVDNREAVLTKGLADPEPRVRYEALQTWGRTLQKQSCAPIVTAVRDSNPHVVLLAIDLLGNGCAEGAAARPLLAIAQIVGGSREEWHRPAHAIVALAKVAPDEARTLLPLYESHSIWQVRMYAARAAARLGATDALVSLARDANDNVREAALSGLVELKRPEAIAAALDALTRPDYQLAISAARGLTQSASSARTVPALLSALDRITREKRETSRDARMALLTRLDELGVHDPGALSAYLHDFDPAIATKAAELLRATTPDAAPEPRLLSHPPVSVADADALRGVRLRFVMRGKGSFDLRLLVDEAPLSCLRVATRAREGYYNGLTFHRVVPNFVIQGGSPGANEYMGDGPFMRDEVGLVSHRRGTVGISTRGRDTGDAQIFVNLVDLPRLDHVYTVFAEVTSGMEVVDAILEGDVVERVEFTASPSGSP